MCTSDRSLLGLFGGAGESSVQCSGWGQAPAKQAPANDPIENRVGGVGACSAFQFSGHIVWHCTGRLKIAPDGALDGRGRRYTRIPDEVTCALQVTPKAGS